MPYLALLIWGLDVQLSATLSEKSRRTRFTGFPLHVFVSIGKRVVDDELVLGSPDLRTVIIPATRRPFPGCCLEDAASGSVDPFFRPLNHFIEWWAFPADSFDQSPCVAADRKCSGDALATLPLGMPPPFIIRWAGRWEPPAGACLALDSQSIFQLAAEVSFMQSSSPLWTVQRLDRGEWNCVTETPVTQRKLVVVSSRETSKHSSNSDSVKDRLTASTSSSMISNICARSSTLTRCSFVPPAASIISIPRC